MSLFRRTLIRALFLGLFFLPGLLGAAVFTVVNSNSSGSGSLAQAVDAANASALPGQHQIVFAIPGPGVHKIELKNPISLASSITIDGYTQPGAKPNTLAVGNNAVILIQLDGGGPFAAGSGEVALGSDCVVRGLSFTGFSGPSARRAAITLGHFLGNNNNLIEGNFIGLSPDGTSLSGNDYGIYFRLSTNKIVIGGSIPAARNIISGNRVGVFGPHNTTIVGNYFGTDATGLRQGYGNDTGIFA